MNANFCVLGEVTRNAATTDGTLEKGALCICLLCKLIHLTFVDSRSVKHRNQARKLAI